MGISIHCGATGIHSIRTVGNGMKFFYPLSERIKEA